MPEFIWDKRVQRYRYVRGSGRGQFVSRAAMESLTRSHIAQIERDILTIGNLFADGKISLATWEEQTAIALKTGHIQSYLLGIGGKSQMTQSDYGILGAKLRSEYEYLRGFSRDIVEEGMSREMFLSRLRLYTSAIRGSQEKGKSQGHVRNGFQWERRRRTKTESCSECVIYAALGWQRINTLPQPTEACTCKSNCGCYKEFAIAKPRDSLDGFQLNFLLG